MEKEIKPKKETPNKDTVNNSKDIEHRLEGIRKVKTKLRSPSLQREYIALMQKKRRIDNTDYDKQRDRNRKAESRTCKEYKTAENEINRKRMAKVRTICEYKINENKRKATLRKCDEQKTLENSKEKRRKAETRQNPEKRKAEQEKKEKRKDNLIHKQRDPLKEIAVNCDQSKFKEGDLSDEVLDSSVGSIWKSENQCKFCKAFKFNNERNFCCGQGKVNIPVLPDPPAKMQQIYSNEKFLRNTRGYNNILAMASIGCFTPEQFRGPNFKIQGKVHHSIGTLIPYGQNPPKFLQLYFYDTDEATEYRMKTMPNLSSC